MKYLFHTALFLVLVACETTGPQVTTTLHNTKASYEPYEETMEKNSRSETVFANYEQLYVMNVAGFTTEFYDSFTNALNERLRSTAMLADIRVNSTYFVSIFSPDLEYNDLGNARLWEFILTVDGREYRSSIVRKIIDRDAWAPFFSFMNRWSNEYLIVFEVPESDQVPSDAKRTLTLANSKAKTEMVW